MAAVATGGCGRADSDTATAASPAPAEVSKAPTSPQHPTPSKGAPSLSAESDAPKADASSAAPLSPTPVRKGTQRTPDRDSDRSKDRTEAVRPEGLAKLPVRQGLGWKPDGPLSSQRLSGQTITLNECAKLTGAVRWQQQGYLSKARNAAGQQQFTFPDAAAAEVAYERLVADMKDCQTTSRKLQAREKAPRDAVVLTTATTKDGTAWSRRWTGAGGMSAHDVQSNHLYAIRQADRLTLFQFDELSERPAPPHDTDTDAAVLGALAGLGTPA
ncbi:hypothetical protein [Streptomyces chryseus]